jgi:hypothetical protein
LPVLKYLEQWCLPVLPAIGQERSGGPQFNASLSKQKNSISTDKPENRDRRVKFHSWPQAKIQFEK